MKLLLAYPEIECSVTRTSTYSVPLGLGSIGTYCKQKLGDSLDVKILDGSMMSHEEQSQETVQYKPDVIGINSTIGSQANAYEIAKLAKDNGSLVLFGGCILLIYGKICCRTEILLMELFCMKERFHAILF
jgi:hypothetical protein